MLINSRKKKFRYAHSNMVTHKMHSTSSLHARGLDPICLLP